MPKNSCHQCRRSGEKLFLKGTRCISAKCSFTRRSYSPGAHGQQRARKLSEYQKQLKEKQKLKNLFLLREKQFKLIFSKAQKSSIPTQEALMQNLERRLDNIVYRLGFGSSRKDARQLVTHGHILVDGKKIDIPSYLVKAKQKINFKDPSIVTLTKTELPGWLSLKEKEMSGIVVHLPERDDLISNINLDQIIEYYSR